MMQLGPYDTVRIRNLGTENWSDKWNNQTYRCASGGEALVPFAGVCLWFGHPAAVDIPGDPRQRYRTEEFQRLCVKYGVYDHHEEFIAGQQALDDRGRQVRKTIPLIEVFDLEGDKLTTVLEDPEGKTLAPFSMEEQANLDLRAQMAQMQRQMQVLQQQLSQQERGAAAVTQSPNVTDDLAPPIPQQTQGPIPVTPPAPPSGPGGHPLIPANQGGPPVPAGYGGPIDDDGNPLPARADTPMPQGEPEVIEDSPTRVRVSG